jgi:hypothetical protein
MSALSDQREDVASTLTDTFANLGVTVHPTWPDTSIAPPAAIVIPGSPYVEHRDGDTFASMTVNLRVVIVTPKAANSVQTGTLDDLVELAIDALHHSYAVEQVEQPGELTVGTSKYLATFIRISTQITLD